MHLPPHPVVLADLGIAASYLANSLDGGQNTRYRKASKHGCGWYHRVLIPYVFLMLSQGGNR